MHVYGELTGMLTSPGTLSGKLSTIQEISGQFTVPQYVMPPAYGGPYEITPSSEAQILETGSFYMDNDVIINPIPSNYGLITYNGSEITVS